VIKIYKLYDSEGYIYNMSVYLGRDRKHAAARIITTHATVSRLTTRIENLEHRLYIDHFFSCPDVFDNLHVKDINCCGTVRPK
jgi:hypothetical protein